MLPQLDFSPPLADITYSNPYQQLRGKLKYGFDLALNETNGRCVGATVGTLPSGAVDRDINGTTYFTYGAAYYRLFYSGSSVIYEVVAKPS